MILVSNNQAFSCKVQTGQPPLCFRELGERSGGTSQRGVQGQLQHMLGPRYSRLPACKGGPVGGGLPETEIFSRTVRLFILNYTYA